MDKDCHMHYTGSLPIDYIWQKLLNGGHELLELEKRWLNVFGNNLKLDDCFNSSEGPELLRKYLINNLFTPNNTKQNQHKFFNLYSLFQTITKPRSIKDSAQFYEEGVYAILKSGYKEGVSSFEIIAGPRKNIDITDLRINNMVRGFLRFSRETNLTIDAKIRLTIIRNSFNSYLNLDSNSLNNLFTLLKNNPGLLEYISGFDFSGYENPVETELMFRTISEIKEFSLNIKRKLNISVHAGEDLINWAPRDYIKYFQDLVKQPISTIGHGTFLWIPKKYLKLSNSEERIRLVLLSEFAKKRVVFEICPTASLLLTPIHDYNEIPFDLFKSIGLRYSINTDNKTIFSTTIKKEYENVRKLPSYSI